MTLDHGLFHTKTSIISEHYGFTPALLEETKHEEHTISDNRDGLCDDGDQGSEASTNATADYTTVKVITFDD